MTQAETAWFVWAFFLRRKQLTVEEKKFKRWKEIITTYYLSFWILKINVFCTSEAYAFT